MWFILISRCFAFIILCSSLPLLTNNELQSIDSNLVHLNICSIQSINIDTILPSENNTSLISQFISSWERKIFTDDDHHSTSLNIIEIVFTIPYTISNQSIINKTISVTDLTHNQLIASLTDICFNSSSFMINYSTNKSLPHNICLYLLLNLTISTEKEIIFCRIIDDYSNDTLNDNTHTETTHAVGPSGFFILSQCIIILTMMFIIYGVQTVRQKSLVNRVSQRLYRSRPYISIFGNKAAIRSESNAHNISINPATTLQTGLNQLVLHRQLASVANHPMSTKPIEEQVLAANDLTSTIHDRRATRPSLNRDLIDIKEFTKRISIPNESSTDTELHPI